MRLVTISPSGRVPGRVSEPSRFRVDDSSGLVRTFGKVIGFRGFSGGGEFIGERAVQEASGGAQVGPRRGPGLTAPRGRLAPVGAPTGALLAPSLFLRKNNLRKFSGLLTNISLISFLKQ